MKLLRIRTKVQIPPRAVYVYIIYHLHPISRVYRQIQQFIHIIIKTKVIT